MDDDGGVEWWQTVGQQEEMEMSEVKHTPGPWISIEVGLIIAKGGHTVALIPTNNAWMPVKDNARLIAAAPDLLDALVCAAQSAGFQYMTYETREMIDAAIAKATGRE